MKKLNVLSVFFVIVFFSSCVTSTSFKSQKSEKINPSKSIGKSLYNSNPISPAVFCADPTSIEYEGSLYVYGTNDHQQYLETNKDKDNTYEKIKSLVCFSTDDMVNWTFHGEINVKQIAPWIMNSWAPSIVSRVEEDGLTHFYLYFSNSGTGVGVITSTSPTGPWTSPLGKMLVSWNSEGLKDCPNPFDPGVCIDDNGVGYLTFGGGKALNGTDEFPGVARIVRLGSDMISLDSDFVEIKAPYFFEASELNFINGTYVYTFNNSWNERKTWSFDGIAKPSACSMAYMTSKNPLDSDSWQYKGHYFVNPGEAGLEYGNNHTHIHKFKNEWYIFYQAQGLRTSLGFKGGFRSLNVDKIKIDEENLEIKLTKGTLKGVSKIKNFSPYQKVFGGTMSHSADVYFERKAGIPYENPAVRSLNNGAWICVKNVDFGNEGASSLEIESKGSGKIEFIFDDVNDSKVASISVENAEFSTSEIQVQNVNGLHDVFILFSNPDMYLKSWQFK